MAIIEFPFPYVLRIPGIGQVLNNYLVRGIIPLPLSVPCFFAPICIPAGALWILLGLIYMFCWLRYESGNVQEQDGYQHVPQSE